MAARIIEELDGFRGDACLVEVDGEYFVVSTITKAQFEWAYGDVETLAFRATEDGTVVDWIDVAGGGDMTRDDVILQLERGDITYLFDEDDDEFWSDYVSESDN